MCTCHTRLKVNFFLEPTEELQLNSRVNTNIVNTHIIKEIELISLNEVFIRITSIDGTQLELPLEPTKELQEDHIVKLTVTSHIVGVGNWN